MERKSRASVLGPPVFQYTSLYVRISEAKNLPNKDMTGIRDVFCYLRVDNESVARTASAFNSSEPFWGEEYNLHVPLEYQTVSVHVYDHDHLGVKVPIGRVMLDRESIISSPRGLDRWFPLKPIKKDDVQGELLVEIMMDEFTEEMYRGVITLVEARDLAVKDATSKVDPYATLNYGGKELATPILKKTRFPRWNKTYEIPIKQPLDDPDNRTLKITLFDNDKFGQDRFLGEVVIDLAELVLGQRYKTWYRLLQDKADGPVRTKDTKKEKDLGAVRLKVQCHEERILDSPLYSSFIELMLTAVDSPTPEGSPLLVMLEEVMTLDRNTLAHTLVRFYVAHSSILALLECLIMKEVNDTTHASTLFRGNSMASKCFDQFMKVAALPYLHETLKPVVDAIYNEKKAIELDPDQLKNIKSRSGSVSKVIETSVVSLTSYVHMASGAIFSSVDKCPRILRQAFKILWRLVSAKFPNKDTSYIAVTGFVFLRFFVPAILSPKLFALRDEHADRKAERTLKLTAKVLQTIGNLQTEVDAKEGFMSPMCGSLLLGVDQVRSYVDRLLDIPDAEDKKASVAVSPDSIYGMGYLQHIVLAAGVLFKRVTSSSSSAVGGLSYRKRYFELTNLALTYYPTEKKTGEAKSYPVQWITVVEKVDEGAFHRKHMFQVEVVPSGPSLYHNGAEVVLYLQAADVNDQNRWVSAIRKACLTNRDMSPVYHPGSYQARKKEWSCCRATASAEPGCCPCNRGITIGDWRDPLDPYLDAQVIYSQFNTGKETLIEKYATKDETSPTRDNDQENGPATPVPTKEELKSPREREMTKKCDTLLDILEELAYHHSTVPL